MTTFLWLCFSALVIWALMNPSRTANFIIAVGKKVLPSYHVEPPATPLVPIKTKAELHAAEHKDWMDRATAYLQDSCKKHIYHYSQWYTCLCCGAKEPWVWKEGCECRYEEVHTIASALPQRVLVLRRPNCRHHGKDYESWPLSERKGRVYGRGYTDNYLANKPTDSSKALEKEIRRLRFDIPEGNK